MRIAGDRAFEQTLGFGGDYAVRCGRKRLAEIGLARCGRTVERQRFAPGRDRIVEATEPHVDRRKHLPAGTVIGIARKVGLDLTDKCCDRLISLR